MGYLKSIELENFKSYKGVIRIGPYKAFTAIIGPNGSGKSNLMDAISFVLGESTKSLRVKKLSDLIHGAPIGKPVANRASVSFVYSYEDLSTLDGDDQDEEAEHGQQQHIPGKEIKFTRVVHGSSSEYRIDGKSVNSQDYQNELEKIGIYLKAKNFLVYQGQVESIAIKNAKEITQVFEEISRSIELKDEYDKLKSEMERAELDTQANFQKKRGVAAQKKEAKMEKEEAEKYRKLRAELQEQELQLRLFQLYYNEKSTEDVRGELEKRQAEVSVLEKKKEKLDEEIRARKREQGAEQRQQTKCEEQIKEVDAKLTRRKPQFIKAKESSTHLTKKLDTARVCHEAALKQHEAHLAEQRAIESELVTLDAERSKFEKEIEKESLSQGISLELRASQAKQYQQLKEECAKEVNKISEQLDALQREQKLDQDALDNETRKRNDAGLKAKQKEYELEEQRVKLSKLVEYITNTETQVEQQRAAELKLSMEIEEASKACATLEDELNKVQTDLGDARIDRFESARSQKKAEVIDQLRKKFGSASVFGRLIDHCEPSHRKYQLAITKVMGKSMDAIVVDTERTARECIVFMKEQRMQSETFYPLDYIDAAPLDERLREIRDAPRSTKMLVDVIKYNPPQMKKALMFAVGNCLVCESDDEARKLAFSSGKGGGGGAAGPSRHKVVSFEGTLFQKSGLISGGSSELRAKARRWDEKHVDALRKKKDTLSEQLREHAKTRRREPDLKDLRDNIRALEHRLKYSRQNKDLSEAKHIGQLERECEQLRKEASTQAAASGDKIEKRIESRHAKLKALRAENNQIEDRIFASFCVDIGVNNIRVYEERELAGQQEHVKQRMHFDERRTRLQTQLEFERSRDTARAFAKWEHEVATSETELANLRADEARLVDEIKKMEEEREKKAHDVDRYMSRAAAIGQDVDELKKRLSVQNKEINDCRKRINSVEARLLDRKLERHAILKNSKIELVPLPMMFGSMEDINDDDDNDNDDEQSQDRVSKTPQPMESERRDEDADGYEEPTRTLLTHSTNDQSQIFEREASIKLDYRQLDTDHLNLSSSNEIDKQESRISSRLGDIREMLHHFATPHLHQRAAVDEKLDTVTEMWESTTAEFDKARLLAKRARNSFVKVKQERYERFMKCFDHINARIDDIYKSLCMNQGAQASLVLENVEEPYAEGIIYNCVAPGKRFRQMDNLSGGEKTVAALGLLFAVRSYNPSPFFVLDEVDAALDNTNISKVANFIKEQSKKGLQCIVISLKEEFFQNAHALIGVYPVADECIASKIISLDLTDIHEE